MTLNCSIGIYSMFLSQYVLAEQETTLKAKNEAADKLIKIVSEENEIVQKEKLIGNNSTDKIVIQFNFYIFFLYIFQLRKKNEEYE